MNLSPAHSAFHHLSSTLSCLCGWYVFLLVFCSVLPTPILPTAQCSWNSSSLVNVFLSLDFTHHLRSPPPPGILIFSLCLSTCYLKILCCESWSSKQNCKIQQGKQKIILYHRTHCTQEVLMEPWITDLQILFQFFTLIDGSLDTRLNDLQGQSETCYYHCHQRPSLLFTFFRLPVLMCSSVYAPFPYQILSQKSLSHQLKSWPAMPLCCGQTVYFSSLPIPATWRWRFIFLMYKIVTLPGTCHDSHYMEFLLDTFANKTLGTKDKSQ